MSGGYHDNQDTRGVFVELWVIDLLDGDVPAALYLSQLLWRCQPAKNGEWRPHMIERDGERWMHRADAGWWDDCRLNDRTVRRIKAQLKKRGLIEACQIKNGSGVPVAATRPLYDAIREQSATRSDSTRSRQVQGHDAKPSSRHDANASSPPSTNPLPKTQEPLAAPSPPAPPAAGANGQLFDAPSQQPPRSAENARATETTRAIYDARDPKPTAPFVGIVQIVKSLLAAGWTEAEVIAAGVSAPALTRNSFEFALNQGRQPAKPAGRARGKPSFEDSFNQFFNKGRNGSTHTPTGPAASSDPLTVREVP